MSNSPTTEPVMRVRQGYQRAAIEQETASVPIVADPPLPPPAPRSTMPSWTLLALSLVALAIQEALTVLHALPQSTPVAIALIVLAGVGAFIVGAEQLLAQYSAHAIRLAMVKRQ